MQIPRWIVRSAVRAKPLVPEKAWPALLAARSLIGDGPVVGLPDFRQIVVLAAHPDDESAGAGGTLRLLADNGCRCVVLFATSGEATVGSADGVAEIGERRRAEARAACHLLGAEARFALVPDGHVAGHIAELGRMVRSLVLEVEAEAVFLPWFADGHADHEALTEVVRSAGLPRGTPIWSFETWCPLVPNRIVDITPVVDVKEKAVAAHATAHRAFDVGAMIGLSRYRSVHGLMGRGYAEAFFAAPADRYLQVAAELGVR